MEGEMYPWPGKLLLIAVPLVGAGTAPHAFLLYRQQLLNFRCSRCFKCLPLLGCPFLFGCYFLSLNLKALQFFGPLCFSLSFLGRPTLLLHLKAALFSFNGGNGAIRICIGGGRGDGGDALFLGCSGSGGPLSLCVDDGLEPTLLDDGPITFRGGGCLRAAGLN